DTEVTLTAKLSLGEATPYEIIYTTTAKAFTPQSYLETFTDAAVKLAESGTSYQALVYTASNGVVWTFNHVTDEDGGQNGVFAIDGTTVVLRRSDEPSSISATFHNGISAFSFNYMKAFTSQRTRTYSVDV